jgi:hypothetical protein
MLDLHDRQPRRSSGRAKRDSWLNPPTSARPRHVNRTLIRRPGSSRWHWLLLIPVIVPLLTPLYNRIDPKLLGIPFFYWCQLAFVALASVTVALVHRLTGDRT